MANITTENINTLAQLAASIDDGDYIYIYKQSSNSFARIEKALLLQGASGGGGSATSETTKANVNLLQQKIDEILDNIANFALLSSVSKVGQLDWGDVAPTPTTPTITTPNHNSNFNIGIIDSDDTSISAAMRIKGANLTQPLSIAISGTGLSVSTNSVTAEQANAGVDVTITYTNSSSGAATTTGTLTISSNELSGNIVVNLEASKAAAGVTYYNVTIQTFGLNHPQPNFTTQLSGGGAVPMTVEAGTSLSIVFTPYSGYTMEGATIQINDGSPRIMSITSVDRIFTLDITVNSNLVISTIAIVDTQEEGEDEYIDNGLVLHLDGKSMGGENGKWIDKIKGKEFVFTGSPTIVTDNGNTMGVTFDSSGEMCVYSGDNPEWMYDECTIEVCFTALSGFTNANRVLFGNNIDHGIAAVYSSPSGGTKGFACGVWSKSGSYSNSCKRADSDTISGFTTLSMNLARFMKNKTTNTSSTSNTRLGIEYIGKLTIGGMTRNGDDPFDDHAVFFANATIHDVRIYNRHLSESEMLANQKLDNDRYNS